MPQPKGVRYGGRQKGTPNKVASDLKALAQVHTPEAVCRLVAHMRGDDPKASVAACKEILNRGHGMAIQFSEAKIEHRTVMRIPARSPTPETWQEEHAPAPVQH